MILTNKGWEDVILTVLKEKETNLFSHIEIKASASPDLPLAAVLYEAKDFINGEDFLLFLGDNLFIGNLEKTIQSLTRKKDSHAIILTRAKDPCRFGVPIFRDSGIESIVEKPRSALTPWVVSGLARYKADIFQIIESLIKAKKSRCDLTEVHNILLSQGKLAHSFWRNSWFDIGTTSAYHQAIATLGGFTFIPKYVSGTSPLAEIFKELNFQERLYLLRKEFQNAGG